MKDTSEIIQCPACGKDMTKIFDETHGINIDICTEGCGGVFFDNREFKHYDEQSENISILKDAVEGKNFELTDQTAVRVCPLCGNNMVKNYASIKKEIQIDECYNCGTKFLDHNELKKIRSQYATEKERSQDVINSVACTVGVEMIQMDSKHQKYQQNRSKFLSSLHEILIDACS